MFRPVRNAARDGLHPGAEQKALVNRTPSLATRSKFGVEAILDPYADAWGKDWASLIIINRFGRSLAIPFCRTKSDINIR